MKNSMHFCFLFLVISCFVLSCQTKEELTTAEVPNLEGDFIIEGFVLDDNDLPMSNIEVKFRAVGEDDIANQVEPTSLGRMVTDEDGFYSISIHKQKLYDSFKKRDHLRFSFRFSYFNTLSIDPFTDQFETIEINFEHNKMEFNKKLDSGAYITIIKKDNPDVELSTDSEMNISISVNQSRTYMGVDNRINEPDTLMERVRVNYNLPLNISWEAKGGFETYYSQVETIQLEESQEYVYWIEY